MTDLNPESQKAAIEAAKKATAECYPSISLDIMENIVRRAVRAALPAYLAAEAERGWAMMPREATTAMMFAGAHAVRDELSAPGAIICGLAYAAMWDAAKDPAHD